VQRDLHEAISSRTRLAPSPFFTVMGMPSNQKPCSRRILSPPTILQPHCTETIPYLSPPNLSVFYLPAQWRKKTLLTLFPSKYSAAHLLDAGPAFSPTLNLFFDGWQGYFSARFSRCLSEIFPFRAGLPFLPPLRSCGLLFCPPGQD